ncbi:hypothetical protein [Fictibacillus sp. KU28468]|uniref:hypothetical protein n=1 Tax=Fictibacillus sp. KU28468 TaxID=2991053 RepID=UPI00223CF0BE|nr:hypothetical protein [Fictibacillus sp. KU28468]UZJ77920.1 hypothetical protein OKX00_17420 [Fictibacillus sp. KU28468]
MLAFTGVNAYFLALAPAGVSPVTLVPQDREGPGSFLSHEENVKFIFEESLTFHFNQLFIEDFQAKKELLKVNFRLSGQPLLCLIRTVTKLVSKQYLCHERQAE